MIDTASAAVDVKRWGVRWSGIQLILSRGAGAGTLAAPTRLIDRVSECENLSIYPTSLAAQPRRPTSPRLTDGGRVDFTGRLTLDRMIPNDHAG